MRVQRAIGRRVGLVLFLLALLCGLSQSPRGVLAQEGAGGVAAPAGDGGAAPAAPASQGDRSFLSWVVHVSGVIGIFIFGLSIYFVAVVVQHLFELRQSVAAPPEILSECEKLINERNTRQLYETLQ